MNLKRSRSTTAGTRTVRLASCETMQDLLFLSRTSNFIDGEEFLAHQYVMIVTPRKVWIPEISFNYRK